MSGNGGGRTATAASLKRPQTPTKRRRGNSAGGGGLKMTASTLDLREAIDSARKTFKRDVKNSASSTPASLSPRSNNSQSQPSQPPKSASAPASPVKRSDPTPPISSGKRARTDKPSSATPVVKRLRRSTNNLLQVSTTDKASTDIETSKQKDSENMVPLSTNVVVSPEPTKPEVQPTKKRSRSTTPISVSTPSTETETTPKSVKSKTLNVICDDDSKRRPANNVSMNEVIKLHQDEGILHLLHALPSSRRKPSQMVAMVARRPSANGLEPRMVHPSSTITSHPSEALSVQEQQQPQTMNQTNSQIFSSNLGHQSQPTAKKVLQDRPSNFLSSHRDRAIVKPCSQEELMTPHALALIKQLPSKEYIRLWSSPSRYVLVNDESKKSAAVMMTVQTSQSNVTGVTPNGSTSSPSSSVSSDMSSVSASRHALNIPAPPLPVVRSVAWTVNGKNYKDILIRTYPTFAQILISPVTTGLKNSLNSSVCEELIDALRQCANEPECRAVLVSGIGSTFCQGVDLTVLTYDSADRQRRSAENLAGSIKKLVTFLLSYPKILLAAVNGVARGVGVTLLPYFDVVFASDKATFSAEYARLGQIPEGFASHSCIAGHLALNEILLFGKIATASEAVRYGLVSSVVWPDKFLEEIVPRVEMLETMSASGLNIVKTNMKQSLKKSVTLSVMEEETRMLVKNWTHPLFAKTVRAHLKTNRLDFQ